jgi:hypothetical protein
MRAKPRLFVKGPDMNVAGAFAVVALLSLAACGNSTGASGDAGAGGHAGLGGTSGPVAPRARAHREPRCFSRRSFASSARSSSISLLCTWIAATAMLR